MSRLLTRLSATAIAVLSVSSANAGPTLDNIKSTNAISIGYREASTPFSYLGADPKPIGFFMDLCAHVVDRQKADLSLPDLRVNLTPVNSSNRIPLIQNGTIDIECGATGSSKKRLEEVSFSVSTFAGQASWLALAQSGLETPEDLKGKTVVVTQGSNAVGIAQSLSQKDGLELNIAQGKDQADSFLLLTSGRAAAFMEDDILLAGLKVQSPNADDLVFLKSDYDIWWYGLMFSKDDPEFKKTIDDGANRR